MLKLPVFTYFQKGCQEEEIWKDGEFRRLRFQGREGLNAESIYSRLIVRSHTLNQPKGSLTFWIMPLEDMASQACPTHMPQFEKNIHNYVLMTDDHIEYDDVEEASFALVYRFNWNDQLFAKFYKGKMGRGALYPQHAITVGGQLSFQKNTWYQMGLSWDREGGDYRIYINGILISRSTIFLEKLQDPCGPYLYMGNPSFAFSELEFYDQCLDSEEFCRSFEEEAVCQNKELQAQLAAVHTGNALRKENWKPDESWEMKVNISLKHEKDLEAFYIQGCREAVSVTAEGIAVRTHMQRTPEAIVEKPDSYDPDQVYLWLREWLEGDVAIEYEFMPEKENGLSLVMFQASGMHREDFMRDYPLRTTGSMRMVHGENVRNYHWEYFREMDDVRHDIDSNILVKNPWGYPLAYQCLPKRLKQNEWHKIQVVQEGVRILGILDGMVVFDVEDRADSNNGPVLNSGHMAIRCMWKTRLRLRNLKVYNRRPPYDVIEQEVGG